MRTIHPPQHINGGFIQREERTVVEKTEIEVVAKRSATGGIEIVQRDHGAIIPSAQIGIPSMEAARLLVVAIQQLLDIAANEGAA